METIFTNMDVNPETFPMYSRVPPLLASLPKHLKDPKNYAKVQKAVTQALQGKCSHGEITEWAACTDCQARFQQSRKVLKKLGFKNAGQYMAWKKVHETIKKRVPFAKYNDELSKH